jgi:hypothetical protein
VLGTLEDNPIVDLPQDAWKETGPGQTIAMLRWERSWDFQYDTRNWINGVYSWGDRNPNTSFINGAGVYYWWYDPIQMFRGSTNIYNYKQYCNFSDYNGQNVTYGPVDPGQMWNRWKLWVYTGGNTRYSTLPEHYGPNEQNLWARQYWGDGNPEYGDKVTGFTTRARIYVDGVLEAESNPDSHHNSSYEMENVTLGGQRYWNDNVTPPRVELSQWRWFDGRVKLVQLYNFPMDHAEVAQLTYDLVGIDACTVQPDMDGDGDCDVDLEDLKILADEWLECGRPVGGC